MAEKAFFGATQSQINKYKNEVRADYGFKKEKVRKTKKRKRK